MNRGFTLIETVVAIAALAILAAGFVSAYAWLAGESASGRDAALMQEIAAGFLEQALSGPYPPAPVTTTVGRYTVNVTPSRNTSVTCRGAACTHIAVAVACPGCPAVTLSADAYAVQ